MPQRPPKATTIIGKPGERSRTTTTDDDAQAPSDNKDAKLLADLETDAETQSRIDKSITRELEGVGTEISGVFLGPLSMSAIMRLHEVGNEIMSGAQVKDMRNPVFAAVEFLYMLDKSQDPDDLARAVFGSREDWRVRVSLWAETLAPNDSVVSEVIDFINESTSSRVKGRLPKALQSKDSEGNDSPRRGL